MKSIIYEDSLQVGEKDNFVFRQLGVNDNLQYFNDVVLNFLFSKLYQPHINKYIFLNFANKIVFPKTSTVHNGDLLFVCFFSNFSNLEYFHTTILQLIILSFLQQSPCFICGTSEYLLSVFRLLVSLKMTAYECEDVYLRC